MAQPKEIKMVLEAIKMLDADFRVNSKCPICGKPKNGLIYKGQTEEQSGLCTCKENRQA